ncbi:hypothetical protein CYMTET_54604 [Cymbomonas tetramitiformis]|uniref:Protein kinase domain-containing protein n=1 Tax=Cymbomonas tetramitiformis TaxID=36881 RepID=A0AAE0BEL1_9CHLO|nr:hypothetical protein CYMTET_54604 [Cymbomonas tetramitiformis]
MYRNSTCKYLSRPCLPPVALFDSSSGSRRTSNSWRTTNPPSPEELRKQAKEATELIQEIITTAVSAGPSGVQRSITAFEAITLTGSELLQGERPSIPVLLRKIFERLGATYVKLGQFIASSPTLFPEEYVLEFQKCLDKTPSVPFTTIKSILEQEMQRPLDQIFESIEEEPLASASVAQVHAAVLKGSNKEIVLKVLKPGVVETLKVDLSFLYITAKVLEFLNPDLKRTSLANIVSDIRTSMMEEVDFTKEAANIEQFQDYLFRMELEGQAMAPFVYKEISTKSVLAMDRLRGASLTDLESIRQIAPGSDPETVLISALNTWFGSIIGCSSFHADVHAGNLLVLPDGRVAFIDFGIVGRIKPDTWGAVQAFLTSVSTADYRVMAMALAQMGATADEVDVDAFARDLEELYAELNNLDAEVVVAAGSDGYSDPTVAANVLVDETEINKLLISVVQIGETHGVKFPREFGLLLKQLLYFDRYVRLLAPELSVLDDERVRIEASAYPSYPSY